MASAKAKLEKSLGGDAFPLDYSTSLRVIRDALAAVSPAPVVVSEGANTMDNARYLLTPPPYLPLCYRLCNTGSVFGQCQVPFPMLCSCLPLPGCCCLCSATSVLWTSQVSFPLCSPLPSLSAIASAMLALFSHASLGYTMLPLPV